MTQDWEQKLDTLYQKSRMDLPPVELDHRIRRAAKDAVKSNSMNWKWYLSSAAVLVLSVSVVLNIFIPDPLTISIQDDYQVEEKQSQNNQPLAEPEMDLHESAADLMLEQAPVIPAPMRQRSTAKSEVEKKSSEKRMLNDLEGFYKPAPAVVVPLEQQVENMKEIVETGDNLIVPESLPFDLELLIANDSSLHGYQTETELAVFVHHRLLLSINREMQKLTFKAYIGAQRWGVLADWGQSMDYFENCSKKTALSCQLTDSVQAFFANDKLLFVQWGRVDGIK